MNRSQRGNRKDDQQAETHLAEVVRHGTAIVIPEDISLDDAEAIIRRLKVEEEQVISVSERVTAFPWDGALALKKALEQTFGVALQQSGFFGARQISVEVGLNETIQVPWGSFALPGVDGQVSCSATLHEGRVVFEIDASVKRKHEKIVKKLVTLTRDIVAKESIYRGKAIKMRFRRDDGNIDMNAQPRFMDLTKIPPTVFSADIQREIDTHVLTPIMYPDQVRAAGTPFKRGVLLAGPPGVGKSLLAANVAKAATQSGCMFLYVENADELPDAIQFASMFQPCVIFVEDVDRVTSGERDEDMDEILNHLDGVATKSAEIMTIMTTNAPNAINKTVLRPGRVDTLLFIDPPDDEAVARLVRHYGREFLAPEEDLADVGAILRGRIPAVIREVVESSKLETIRRTHGKGGQVRAVDIVDAAKTYIKNEARLTPPTAKEGDLAAIEAFGKGIAGPMGKALATALQSPERMVALLAPDTADGEDGGRTSTNGSGRKLQHA